ncbi:MAG: hypothetical protein K0R28_2795 [Paenibacillus sp.]|nr:hypothetical protein [Paenibacillus sp.]
MLIYAVLSPLHPAPPGIASESASITFGHSGFVQPSDDLGNLELDDFRPALILAIGVQAIRMAAGRGSTRVEGVGCIFLQARRADEGSDKLSMVRS